MLQRLLPLALAVLLAGCATSHPAPPASPLPPPSPPGPARASDDVTTAAAALAEGPPAPGPPAEPEENPAAAPFPVDAPAPVFAVPTVPPAPPPLPGSRTKPAPPEGFAALTTTSLPSGLVELVPRSSLEDSLAGLAAGTAAAAKPFDQLWARYLNVGAGSCQIVECPGNTSPILFDCGSRGRSQTDMSAEQAAAYLQPIFDAYGGRPIVTISHPDADHYNYIPTVMGNRYALSIWLGGQWNDYDATIRSWIMAQNAAGVPVYYGFPAGWSNQGQPVGELGCGNAQTYVMTVNVGTTTNSQSLIARVQYNAFSIMFTGDATGATQRSAASNWLAPIYTVVLTGSHHGASTDGSNDATWADATRPKVTVFSSGTSYYHPRCEAVAVYGQYLQPMPVHPIWCGTSTGYVGPYKVDRGEYVTEINGIVSIVTDGSVVGLGCTLTPC